MKAGKIMAKIRDAVKVRLMEDGKERMMYRNIDLPDAIKELEVMDFGTKNEEFYYSIQGCQL